MSATLNKRICDYYNAHDIMVEEQNGFRTKWSCEEHIFTISSIIRDRKENNISTCAAFIDLENGIRSTGLFCYIIIS